MTTLKLMYNNDVRRVLIEEAFDYPQVMKMVEATFGITNALISYLDDEDDLCRITRSQELEEALRITTGNLKLIVTEDAALPDVGTLSLAPSVPAGGRVSKEEKQAQKKLEKTRKREQKLAEKALKKARICGEKEAKRAAKKEAKRAEKEANEAKREKKKAEQKHQLHKKTSECDKEELEAACNKLEKLHAKVRKLNSRVDHLSVVLKRDFPHRKLLKATRKASAACNKALHKSHKCHQRIMVLKNQGALPHDNDDDSSSSSQADTDTSSTSEVEVTMEVTELATEVAEVEAQVN